MSSQSEREIIIVGDRVLIRPEKETNKTDSGLFLPEGVKQKEKVQEGYVVQVGPGYAIPDMGSSDEPWTPGEEDEDIRYMPLQAEPGDYAVFLRKDAIEVSIDEEPHLIVSHSSILLLLRDPELLE